MSWSRPPLAAAPPWSLSPTLREDQLAEAGGKVSLAAEGRGLGLGHPFVGAGVAGRALRPGDAALVVGERAAGRQIDRRAGRGQGVGVGRAAVVGEGRQLGGDADHVAGAGEAAGAVAVEAGVRGGRVARVAVGGQVAVEERALDGGFADQEAAAALPAGRGHPVGGDRRMHDGGGADQARPPPSRWATLPLMVLFSMRIGSRSL